MMRTVNIRINDDKTVAIADGLIGYVEESKATQLIIALNTELQSSEIDYYIVCFRHGENDEKLISGKITRLENPEEESDYYKLQDKLYLSLPQYVTRYPNLYIQVEGHVIKTDSESGNEYVERIIKSPVFMLRLDESIVGNEGEFNDKVEGIFSDLQDMSAKLNAAMPTIEMLEDGVEWDEIGGYTKPLIQKGIADGSIVMGNVETNATDGKYSVAIGNNLRVKGEYTVLVGQNGIGTEGLLFGVANGSSDKPSMALEVGPLDAQVYIPVYGVTPELTAPNRAMATVKWIKDYISAYVYPKYDQEVSELKSSVNDLNHELSEGLDQASIEVLELRDTLLEQITNTKPTVSNVLVLTSNGWQLSDSGKYVQTVLVEINTLNRNEIDVEAESIEEWAGCSVLAVSENSSGIVFECNELPKNNLRFRITSLEVNYAV